MDKRIIIKPEDEYRLIAISDIHGHVGMLKRLLERLEYKKESDYLVILGDFINKGKYSIDTFEYVKELDKNERVIVLKGNHEYFINYHLTHEENVELFMNFIEEDSFYTIVKEILDKDGIELSSFQSANAFYEFFQNNYQALIQYINSLNVILEFDEFVFVHGGYGPEIDENDEIQFLKYDNYQGICSRQEKTVIVGHWPVSNIHTDRFTNYPVFNKEKNVISIDGGLGVQKAGELNALIIKRTGNDINYEVMQENHFEPAIITKAHTFNNEERVFVNYPFFEIEVLEHGEFMSRCRHMNSNKEFSVFSSLLEKTKDGYGLKTTYINHLFNLDVGEKVEVCMLFNDCVLVKYNDEFGWILREQIE